MNMNVLIGIGVGIYFGLGIVALGILDIATGRIRNRLASASRETRDKLLASGSLVGNKESLVLIIGALWVLWPAAVFAALTGGKNGEKR